MSLTCPRCSHVRQPGTTTTADGTPVPDWQCPACGVAYAKAAEAAAAQRAPAATPQAIFQPRPQPRFTAGRLLLWALVLGGAAYAWHAVQQRGGPAAAAAQYAGGDSIGSDELQALAATVRPGDIVIYTTTTCPYCAQAKSWMQQQGFAFTECNTSESSSCEREFGNLAGRGVPLMVVRGKRLEEGFDGRAFLAALRS